MRIVLIVLTLLLLGCNEKRGDGMEDSSQLDYLFRKAMDAARKEDFNTSDSLGRELFEEARMAGDKVYEAYGLLAQSFYPKTSAGCEQRLARVKEAEKIALATDNDTLLSWVYNVLGIYSTVYDSNFSQARHYYSEAIKYAKRINETSFIISAECNIAELYHSIGDTLGHGYDLDIYKYALEHDNKVLLLPSAQRCAEYYIETVGRPESALPYIDNVKVAGSDYLFHLLRGKYYMAVDSFNLAEEELNKALRQGNISPNVYLTYGKLLNITGKYAESNDFLSKAEAAYREIDSKGFGHVETRRLMSDNYRKLGEVGQALSYLELYINGRDSVNRLRNMEEINSYKVRFDVEKKELELARNHEIMRRQAMTIWGVAILLMLAGGFYLFYKLRKRSMQRLIVRQQKDFLIERSSGGAGTSENVSMASDAQKGLSEDKADSIWRRIEHEMDVNRIYTDTTVTRDIFSERVGCNHTWFSQVIKERTGKSYLQFMNSRRIKEAIKILSDPVSDITQKDLAAKLGFLSASTFYSAFKQQVGMSPAEYRKIAIAEVKSAINNEEEC